MNAFEKHGLRNLSPSALTLWRASPALYVGKYLLKWRDDASASAWWGDAVEAGLSSWLYKRDDALAIEAANRQWDNRAMGEVSDKIDDTKALVVPALVQAKKLYADRPAPTSVQAWVECWLDGVPVPIRGKTDFQWPECVDDLKTTKQCPSAPKDDHLGQFALYARGTGKPVFASYVTAKRGERYEVTSDLIDRGIREMTETAHTLMRFLARVEDGRDALALLPADTTDFRWNDAMKAFLATERQQLAA